MVRDSGVNFLAGNRLTVMMFEKQIQQNEKMRIFYRQEFRDALLLTSIVHLDTVLAAMAISPNFQVR